MRESIGTTNWADALAICEQWERAGRIVREPRDQPKTFAEAFAHFKREKLEADEITAETWRKYQELGEKLKTFLEGRIETIDELRLEDVDEFRSEAKKTQQNSTLAETVRRVKHFVEHCERHDWITYNLSGKIKMPKVIRKKKKPYNQQQQISILAACQKAMDRAFVLFMRYTGFAIEDAANCPKANLGPLEWHELPDGRKVELARVWIGHRAKLGEAGEVVDAWIPRFVVEALDAFPHKSKTHWFKSDRANPKSAAKVMSARLLPIFKAAGVEGRSHGFRRTLSDSVLSLKGMQREDAALLLGNTPEIVGRHYHDPKTQGQQLRGKNAAALALADDPIANAFGTSAAHEELTRAN